jgi:hypothetical protein
MSADELIRDVCAYLGDDKAERYYVKVARQLKHALFQFNIHLNTNIKSIPITVNANMTANLPNDVVVVAKVGVCCSNGKIQLLGRNDSLCAPKEEEFLKCCTCENEESTSTTPCCSQNTPNCCDACTFHNMEFSGTFPWGLPGLAPRYLYGYTPQMFQELGYYRHDQATNLLIFSGGYNLCAGSVVIVEYQGATTGEEYQLIPRNWYYTLQHFIAYQLSGAKDEANWRQFKIQYDMVKRTLHNYTLEDIVSALRGTYKSSPKR